MKPEILKQVKRRCDICFYSANPNILRRQLLYRKYNREHSRRISRRYTLFENKHLIRKILFTSQLKK